MINRRRFLKLGAASVAGVPALASENARAGSKDYAYQSGTERESVATACALCSSRCAAIAYVEDGRVVKVEGQPDSQRTQGKLCAKGQAGVSQVYDPDRILQPLKRVGKRGEGKWEKISWDDALGELATKLKDLRQEGHPEKFMFHHGWISASADKLINQVFLPTYGTATIASNSCHGQSARLTAHELTWGGANDSWDFDNTRFILNFGSNIMEADNNHVALARRLSFALIDHKAEMFTFDVRLSNTAAKSTAWIQIRPGTDAAVVLAMCHVVINEELYRGRGEEFLTYCQVTPDPNASIDEKIAALKAHLTPYTPAAAEKISGVDASKIREIAIKFASEKSACVISSRGASAQYNGVETERAIQMLAAITGNIDNPGGRCLGVAPQWVYPTGPEDKPASRKLDILNGFEGDTALPNHGIGHQVFKMIRDGRAGRPEVYMWYNYNPAFSNGNVQENINTLSDEIVLPYTVAVTPFYDESAALADLILPDAVYLETYDFEDGISPNQIPEFYIRQPTVKPQGEARDFKDVCCDLAQRMEMPLGFASAEEFLEQSCDLTPGVSENAGGFDGMKERGVWSDPEATPAYYSYRQTVSKDSLQEDGVIMDKATGVYWNWRTVGVNSESKALDQGYRQTPDAYRGYIAQKIGDAVYAGFKPEKINKSGYFEIYSPLLQDKDLPPLPTYTPIPEHRDMKPEELVLTTFRVNVQTLSRTQNCHWLNEISTENPGWINPKTAAERGIKDGDRIKIRSMLGEIETTAKVTMTVMPGVIALSSHGGHWEYGRYASGKNAPFSIEQDSPTEELKWWVSEDVHPNWIIDNVSEPISGQQRWMDTVVSVSRA